MSKAPLDPARRTRPPGALRQREAVPDEGGRMTLQAIADELGVTREGARQIEAHALQKLAKALHDRGCDAGDFFD